MSKWINFKELRGKLDFERVLQHYGVETKRKGDQHLGFCPLPNHNGKKNSPSFSANLKKGIFQCFGCGAKGNVLDFATMMEKINLEDGAAFRGVVLELQKRFCPEMGADPSEKKPTEKKVKQETKPESAEKSPAIVNAPLDFELKGLDQEHPYLAGRGFSKETASRFGLGFCSRSLLKERLAIPLHDHEGKLVGYAGRVIDDTKTGEDNPKYRFPGAREREGKIYEFRKGRFLYNGFRIKAPVDDLLVVEGFASVWWLRQLGFEHVIATMGADCSERQAELIVSVVKNTGRVWIIPDCDKAGERLAQSLLAQISPYRFVRWIKLENAKQPTDYDHAYFRERLAS